MSWIISEAEYQTLTGKMVSTKKAPKYHNKKVYEFANGFVSNCKEDSLVYGKPIAIYDSQKEYNRWMELQLLQRAGEVTDLLRQAEWIISDACEYNGGKIRKISYKADFQYKRNGKQIVEDVKPFDNITCKYRTTKDFRIKWKLLKGKYPDTMFELF